MNYSTAIISVGNIESSAVTSVIELCREHGFTVVRTSCVPKKSAEVSLELIRCTDVEKLPLILTLGGTSLSPSEITPEATLAVLDRKVPGIAEAMRYESFRITKRACVSRGVSGIRCRSLIVNLPGSKKAAGENLLAVIDALQHAVEMLSY